MDPLTLTLVASLAAPAPLTLSLPRLGSPVLSAPVVTPAPLLAHDPEESNGPLRNLGVMTAGLVATQVGTLYLLSYLPANATGWGEGSFRDIPTNDLRGPRWDTDRWGWNYVAHPVVGSEYYLLARNREVPWWGSFLYAVGMSTFWEFFTEAYYERPSGQDLLITPLAGAILGELRWQAKLALRTPPGTPVSTWKAVLTVVLDPIEALTEGP